MDAIDVEREENKKSKIGFYLTVHETTVRGRVCRYINLYVCVADGVKKNEE